MRAATRAPAEANPATVRKADIDSRLVLTDDQPDRLAILLSTHWLRVRSNRQRVNIRLGSELAEGRGDRYDLTDWLPGNRAPNVGAPR